MLTNGRRVLGDHGITADGSFGELVLGSRQWLEGANTIEIRSVRGSSDLTTSSS